MGGQGGWERRIEAFVKILFFWGGGGVGSGKGRGGRHRLGGVRVDENGEVKFL